MCPQSSLRGRPCAFIHMHPLGFSSHTAGHPLFKRHLHTMLSMSVLDSGFVLQGEPGHSASPYGRRTVALEIHHRDAQGVPLLRRSVRFALAGLNAEENLYHSAIERHHFDELDVEFAR